MCAHSNNNTKMSHPFRLQCFCHLFATHLSWLNWGISLNANQLSCLAFIFHVFLFALLSNGCTTELKSLQRAPKLWQVSHVKNVTFICYHSNKGEYEFKSEIITKQIEQQNWDTYCCRSISAAKDNFFLMFSKGLVQKNFFCSGKCTY